MKRFFIFGLVLLSSTAISQGIYSDYGIERIYCFSNTSDIEIELVQDDNILHTFSAKGGDISNMTESVTVERVPNGVSFYLPDIERSTVVVIIDDKDNVKFEGLSALTGSMKK